MIISVVTTFAQTSNQPYTIYTLAGGGVPENTPAASAELGPISAMAVDPSGTLYLALEDYNVIERVGADGILTRVAGNGTSGFSGDGGPATQAQLGAVYSLAAAPNGDLLIVDYQFATATGRIRKVSNGTITTVAGGGTQAPGPAPLPATSVSLRGGSASLLITFDPSGDLIIAVTAPVGPALLKLSGDTISQLPFSAGACSLLGPYPTSNIGLAADASGKIYLASYSVFAQPFGYRQIQGCVVSFPGNDVVLNGVYSPLAVDPSGQLYYISGGKVLLAGSNTPFAGTSTIGSSGDGGPATKAYLNGELQIAFDGQNNLYILQNSDNRVRRVSNGIITTVAGTHAGALYGDGGPAYGAQLSASGAAIGPDGSFYFAESIYHRIRKITNGIVTTIAGTGDAGYSGDGGPATAAELRNPQTVAVDSAGNIYVADTGNFAIRKITNGQIQTIAAGNGSSFLEALVVDALGHVFINSGEGVQQVVNGSWDRGSNLFALPSRHLAKDGAGNLYGIDYSTGSQILELSNGVTSVIGSLASSTSVTADQNGNVYAAAFSPSTNNVGKIYRLANGFPTPIAGGGTETADGVPALSALLTNANVLAVDDVGRVYISGNGVIRVLVPAGVPPPSIHPTYVPAALINPTSDSTLTSSSATLTWTPGTNALGYGIYVGTSFRASDILTQDEGNNQSTTVTGLPTNGGTVYITIWTNFQDQGWIPADYAFATAGAGDGRDIIPAMISPAPSSKLTGSTVTFTWTAGKNTLGYGIYVGTSFRASDILVQDQGTKRSAIVTGLPTNGSTVYMTVWTNFEDQGWIPADYAFNAASSGGGPNITAAMNSPAPSSTLTGSAVTFSWTAGKNALDYHLYVGTTFRGTDILTQNQGTWHSTAVTGLPSNGATLYVTLWTHFADQGWVPVDYVYNAVSIGEGPDITAAMNSPTPSSTLISSAVTFSWTAGRNALDYHIYVGTTFRGTDILTQNQGTWHSTAVTGLPINGATLYVTLWTHFADQGWVPVDYVYKL